MTAVLVALKKRLRVTVVTKTGKTQICCVLTEKRGLTDKDIQAL